MYSNIGIITHTLIRWNFSETKNMKKFFKGLVADIKFNRAGEGHNLSSDRNDPPQASSSHERSTAGPRSDPTVASVSAGCAAMERVERQQQQNTVHVKPRVISAAARSSGPAKQPERSPGASSKQAQHQQSATPSDWTVAPTGASVAAGEAALQRQHSKEVGKPKARPSSSGPPKSSSMVSSAPHVTEQEPAVTVKESTAMVDAVRLTCPVCGHSVPFKEVDRHFEACLQEEYLKEAVLGSAQIIHTLCKDQDKKATCIDTLSKYLQNIRSHPGEEKYRRIRISNKAFQERVASVKGGLLFLEAVGFKQRLLPHEGQEEQFYVYEGPGEGEGDDQERLSSLEELLQSCQPLRMALERGLTVYRATSRAHHFDLPREFYHLTVDEIKREQKLKTEAVEKEMMLRTRAMREKDETKSVLRYYRFVLLRVRMPDNYIVQGVFRPLERVSDVRSFILGALSSEAFPFNLLSPAKTLEGDNATLAELGLAPASVLTFSWACPDMVPPTPFIKPHLLENAKVL